MMILNQCCRLGADMFVAGSAILKNPRTKDAYASTISSLRESLGQAKI